MQEQPHNLEAEQAVLAAMLIDPEAVIKAMNLLQAEDFYRETHKLIFRAMEELCAAKEPLNIISLQDCLANKKQLEQVGLAYLLGLGNAFPTGAQVEQFANIVKAKALRRRLNLYGRTVAVSALQGEKIKVELEEAYKQLLELMNDKQCLEFKAMPELVEEYLGEVTSKEPRKNSYTGLATYFLSLDELTNGLQPGDFIILAARPSMGKTAMALSIAANLLFALEGQGCRIGFFSMEMSRQQLINRLMANLTGIDSLRLQSNRLDQEEWTLIWKATEIMGKGELFIDDTGSLTVGELQSRARRLHLEKPLDILFVDYLQLMNGSCRNQERQQAIAEISRGLKALAKELNIPVVALSQLSRAVEGRFSKKPVMSDLRESGSLEQDADIVMFLYREDYYNEDCATPGITELILAKHRNGPVGNIKLFFDKPTTRFLELV